MSIGATAVAKYRKRFTPNAYMQHRQEWFRKSTYGENPATGNYEAYQKGTVIQQAEFYTRPDQLPDNVSLDSMAGL